MIPHLLKPDVDNYLKFAMDCLIGEVYRDDSQVAFLHRAGKFYAIKPRTVIMIWPWDEWVEFERVKQAKAQE